MSENVRRRVTESESMLIATDFRSPLDAGYTLTQGHGDLFAATGRYHIGQDWANGSSGGQVSAIANGVVVYSGYHTNRDGSPGYGNLIAIQHTLPDGSVVTSFYAHLKSRSVKVGDEVRIGDPIGKVGNTGYSTGPHLHFAIYMGVDADGIPLGSSSIPDPDPHSSWVDPSWFIATFASDGNQAPVVSGAAVQDIVTGQSISGATFVDVTDPDGAGDIDFVRFWDATAGTDGGYWTFDGVRLSGQSYYDVALADLGRIAYVGGASGGSNQIVVEAFDLAGAHAQITITINITPAPAPVFTAGNDHFDLATAGTYHALAGNDRITGSSGDDVIFGQSGRDVLRGSYGDDVLNGGGGRDVLKGGAGDDHLIGGRGHDKLIGGGGADDLIGGRGRDTLIGGGGADRFIFRNGDGRDRVMDFVDDVDTLVLSDTLWGGGKTVAQVIDQYASVVNGDVVFDFGGGDVLVLKGIGDTAVLLDDLVIV